MADKPSSVHDVLINAKLGVDAALKGVLGELSPAQLQRLRQLEDTNTSCTNTGCGKAAALKEEVARPE